MNTWSSRALFLIALLCSVSFYARDADAASCRDTGAQCSLAAATAECEAQTAAGQAANPAVYSDRRCYTTYAPLGVQGQLKQTSSGNWVNYNWYPANGQQTACATAQPIHNRILTSGGTSLCHDGCVYHPKSGNDTNSELSFCVAGNFCAAKTWEATGTVCPAGTTAKDYDPNRDTCVAMSNGYGECVKPDGMHCWKSDSGKSVCWRPGQTGERSTLDGTFGGDRKVAPGAPTAPSNMQTPTQQTTSTTTINNTTYNSASYSSSGGNGTPGQGDTGVDGDSDGDGKPDDGPGSPGGNMGDLYTPTSLTAGGIAAEFKARVLSAPIINASSQFLTVSVGASCPVFTMPATDFWSAMTMDYHCQGPLATMLSLGAWLLVAVAAYTAFKIGFG